MSCQYVTQEHRDQSTIGRNLLFDYPIDSNLLIGRMGHLPFSLRNVITRAFSFTICEKASVLFTAPSHVQLLRTIATDAAPDRLQ